MLRWVIALLSAYFVLAFGASAYSTTNLSAPTKPIFTQSILSTNAGTAYVQHELRELHDSNKPEIPVEQQPCGSACLQLVLDDLLVDIPDLVNSPSPICADAALRIRLSDESLVPPHSPSLKRRPKPPRAFVALA